MAEIDRMPDITISPANPDDAANINQLIYETWKETFVNEAVGITPDDVEDRFKHRLNPTVLEQAAERYTNPPPGEANLVARDGNNVVGFCRVNEHGSENELSILHVHPSMHRRGISRSMWASALKQLNPSKDTVVWVADYNQNAIDVYK